MIRLEFKLNVSPEYKTIADMIGIPDGFPGYYYVMRLSEGFLWLSEKVMGNHKVELSNYFRWTS